MKSRVGAACVVAALLATGQTPSAQLPLTLSGTVFGGGAPLAGAAVEALQDGTTTVVGSSTTNAQGSYSISLPAATYDLRVTPPSGSDFGQETIQDVVLDSNKQQDVLLVAGDGIISGIVRGYGGIVVSGLTVAAQLLPSFQSAGQTQTDSTGRYSLPLADGMYRLLISGSGRPNSPPSFSWDRRNVTVAGSTELDVQLPIVRVTGSVRDALLQSVQNARLTFSNSSSASPLFTSSSGSVLTSADGSYSYLVLTGNTTVTVTPPAGSSLSSSTETVSFTTDSVRDYTLASQEPVSGTVRGYQGQPIPFASIQVRTWPESQLLTSVTANASGQYSVVIPAVSRLIVSGTVGAGTSFSWDRRNLAVSGTQLDISIPVVRLTGTVRDSAGNPVAGSTVRTTQSSFQNDLAISASSQTATTTEGSHDMSVLAGPTVLTAVPPIGASLGMALETVTLTADASRDLVLPAALRLTGVVRGYGGMPVSGAQVEIRRASDFLLLTSGVTNLSGAYDLPAVPGNVRVRVFPGGRANAPTGAFWERASVAVSGPTVLEIVLPVVRIAGRVNDSNGVGVPSVRVQVSNSFSQTNPTGSWNSSGNVLSDSHGRYAMLLFQGTGGLTVQPPAGSGFAAGALPNFTVSTDLEQAVVLQRPDTTPPAIVSGPTVVHLSDTSVSIGWTTDEPATSMVSYGQGTVTQVSSDNALVTNHSITLLDLTPVSLYTFHVSSFDRAGNGPVSSAQAFFTTQPFPGDVTPPVITSGPHAVFVDQTSAIVQWTTDEPTTSTLEVGETSNLGTTIASPFGRFVQSHSVRITGLAPATTFFYRVRPADPDENEVESGLGTFTTLTVPDTQAPVITQGPTDASVSDTSMTITWTTDEAADSGVSYTDGTTFFTVRDEAFVKLHSVRLTGLNSVTAYQITVSSRDAAGNGPVLGGPIIVVTAETPDTSAPLITDVSVVDVSETSAAVTWTTHEPATSRVAYGTTSGSLTESRAGVTLTQTHRLLLTGLQAGTTYYFAVSSSDAATNTATASEASFTTLPLVVDSPPSAPSTPVASRNPSNTGTFTISWNPSTDDIGIAGYEVLRNGDVVAHHAPETTLHQESNLAEGVYAYRIRVRDTGGHVAVSGELSMLVDRTAPTLDVPNGVTVDATEPTGAKVTFMPEVSDNFDPQPSVNCNPSAGSHFGIGEHVVVCEAVDAAGNRSTASFDVTVRDVVAPALAVPADITVDATASTGAVVVYAVSASDNFDPQPTVSCDHASGATYPIDTTIVTCTARDTAGNSSVPGQFAIKVLGAAEQTVAALELIAAFNLPATTEQSLTVKVEQALSAPNTISSCNELGALLNTVRAQLRSDRLTSDQAEAIISATQQVMIVQGCR